MVDPIIQTTNLSDTFQALRSRDPLKVQRQNIEEHPDYKRVPRANYAPIAVVNTGNWGGGMTRLASASTGGTIYGQPGFFSPIHTNINWQIPSKRLEQYQWARFFYENEPKVGSAIDFYADFPMSDWEHECRNRKVKVYFDRLKQRLKLNKWCRLISHEVHLLGDCFPFTEIDCPSCGGSGKLGTDICEHEGGTVRRVIILNPDYVEVLTGAVSPDPVIALRPDEELINMVQRKTPGYEKLSMEVIKLISAGQPIRLDNRNVAHIKYGECGYQKYGVGMVRRLFPILSYKTKLMVAQWIVAERLIVPIKIVKVGSDERPAGPADIAAVQAQLASTANDPNLTIVTHHAFDLDWIGAAGKILTLSTEFEFVNQEILDGMMINNALLNGEGPNFCVSDCTRILCKDGLKYRTELDIEKDLIATFNKNTGKLEYQKATKKWEYNYNSIDGDDKPMKRFLTNRIDMLVTPNHKMLLKRRKLTTGPRGQKLDGQIEGFGEWEIKNASEVKVRSKFRACVDGWDGTNPKKEYFGIKTDDFLRIVGWYISEGWKGEKSIFGKISYVGIAQDPIANPETYNKIKEVLQKYSIYHVRPSRNTSFYIQKKDNKELMQYLCENCGDKANSKHIPSDLKNMSSENLKILLESLVDGDGSERPATKKKPTDKKYYSYTTVSTQLRDDVIEILFKLGFSPRFTVIKFDTPNLQTQYTISWGETEIGKFPVLDSRRWNNDTKSCNSKSEQVISDEDYVGKVWCVEVPNHFIITERNGLFGIHGNSSAAVGIEAMIQRLKTFRQQVSEWLLESIYIPEAIRQGFVEKNPETGEDEVIIPKIKWNSMHLRDQQQDKTFAIQLYEKGLLSAQTVLELFDYDPDQEIERKRYDSLQMIALGQGVKGPGGGGMGGGGGLGGLPSLGGGGGEPPIGAPGGGEMGGPGTPMGTPPSPVGGGVGGPPISKASSISAVEADPGQFGGMVLRKNTRDKINRDRQRQQQQQQREMIQQQKAQNAAASGTGQMRDEKGRIVFTGVERQLIPLLKQAQKDGLLKGITIYPQHRVTSGEEEYVIDFAVPQLKIGIEADGEVFHSSPKQVQHDKERDMLLAQQGWTIARFTDRDIEHNSQQVVQEVIRLVMQKQLALQNVADQAQQRQQGK